ncbi:MAG: FAD-binding oxidoreductase, partial [Acidimicrobiia bacterium]
MQNPAIEPATISIPELREEIKGDVITPDDPGYDEARAVYYGIDRRPALVIRPTDAEGVAHAVSLARDSGVELAIRSGGHSLAGHGVTDSGIVLDLSSMKGIHLDAEQRTVWAQTG